MKELKCIIWETPLKTVSTKLDYDNALKTGTPVVMDVSDNYNQSWLPQRVCNPRAGGEYFAEIRDVTYNHSDEAKVQLSSYIAQENLKGYIPYFPFILPNRPDNEEEILSKKLGKPLSLIPVDKLPPIPLPGERAELLLRHLVKTSTTIGKKFNKSDLTGTLEGTLEGFDKYIGPKKDFCIYSAVSYCSKLHEMGYLIDYLKDCQYIQFDGSGHVFVVTVKGFEKIRNVSNIDSKKAFIAMWIHQDTDQIHKAIEEAVIKTGYEPVRIDKKEHVNKIDDEILSEINKARFIVCDLSSEKGKHRGSVYFEAGYALGTNIPIIWTCKKELIQDIHFDIRQYNCLAWEEDNTSDFTNRLQHRIENIIGKNN